VKNEKPRADKIRKVYFERKKNRLPFNEGNTKKRITEEYRK